MEVFKENRLELVVSDSGRPANSYQGLLDSQMELFYSQTDQLENILATQCALTGVNPLSQEMAAGALSIKIGKRPRDLLNPKAVKYMQSVFSIKDAITKKESREISALFGVTVTQVREFFNSQRSRVRKYVRLSRDKALRCSSSEQVEEGVPMSNDPAMPIYPVPLNCMEPARVEEGASSSTLVETLPGLDDSDRHFQENIFSVMRKEETFSGQVKLMEWILQIQSSSLLLWFLTNGGVMILATWLSQAASEEQTSVLHVILEVLCYLPLHKAFPVHMSAILQSVNRLRFYKTSDISNRARNLLSKWSKMFARAQALKKPIVVKSSSDAENEMLLKQSISEIMGDKLWESKFDLPGDSLAPSIESPENFRRLESTQPLKLLPSSADDSNKKPIRGVSSLQTKERRKVLFVEQPGQKPTGRSSQVARSVNVNQGRPLSADDIQKAKIRAHFMQSKHGKSGTVMLPASKPHVRPEVEQQKEPMRLPPKVPILEGAAIGNKMNLDVDERLWKKCRKVQIPWKTPAEMNIADAWSVGTGANSKEVEIQRNRIRREKETIYRTTHEIPRDPNEPWDREMEYDDTLTLEIPIEQLPDNENGETEPSTSQIEPTSVNTVPPLNIDNGSLAEPDPQLLAELLKHPELVFALQSGGLSGEEMVKLLDMIKANGVASLGSLANGLVARKVESVPVSLPSPTPSSDAVTSGWRPEVAKNPFSRQSRGTVAMSEVAVSTSSRVRSELLPVNTVAQQLLTASTRCQREMPQYSLPHAAAVSTISALQQAPAINSSNRPLNNPHLSNLHSMQIENSGYVKPAAVSITVNRPPVSFQTPPTPQPHLRFVAEPMLPSHSWRPNQNQNQNWASNPHFQPHQNNNYNGFVQLGPYYRERNEFVSGAEFESWSPDNSPFRPTGWSYPEQRMNTNTNMGQYNFRPEFDGPGPWNASGFRDYNGHGNKRRRDWRR